jgi:hypothetical protein
MAARQIADHSHYTPHRDRGNPADTGGIKPNFHTFGKNSVSDQCIRFLGTTPVSLDLGVFGLSASPERWAAM